MRRRRKREIGGNLDSLMDTMTNVVGILVIVLVFTQLSVGDAVKRIRNINEALPDVEPAVLEEAKKQAAELRKFIEEHEDLAKDAEKSIATDVVSIKELEQQIAQLKKMVASDPQLAAALSKTKSTVAQREKQEQDLKKKMADTSRQIQDLKAMLDKTPVPKVSPAIEVTLPDPRPAPKGWTPLLILCKKGRLFELDYTKYQKLAQKKIERNRRLQIKEDDVNVGGFDEKKVIAYFDRDVLRNPNFKITVKKYGKNLPYLMFNLLENGGDTAESLVKRGSKYQRLLAKSKSNKKYMRFIVYDDSFEVYLAARTLAQLRGVPAGWAPSRFTTTPWHTRLGDDKFNFNRLKADIAKEKAAAKKRAEEAAKNPKPKPKPKPSRIPPPKAKSKKATQID
jgi:hypothetical protein